MTLNLQYVTGKNGRPSAVQIPIREWESLMKDYKHSKQLSKLRNDLTAAISEINEFKKGKKKPVLLKDFLNEL
jgi:PHD/YefM family antitoxin component YafN of YafNO toxin-antitoxin module